MISQGDSRFVGVYPHMSPHRRIGFTARRPAGNMMVPDRCQTPEVPILQTSICRPCLNACDRAIYRQADGQMWQECGRPWHETGNQPPIDGPNDLSRAPNAASGNPPLGKDPRGYFSSARKGGGVEQDRMRAHKPFPKFPVGGPAPIFWPNFLGKNFGNKNPLLASPRRGCYARAGAG